MNSYSGNTRITLTATGWLFIAQEALAEIEQASDPKQAAELRRKAKKSLRRTLVGVDEDARSGQWNASQLAARLATCAEVGLEPASSAGQSSACEALGLRESTPLEVPLSTFPARQSSPVRYPLLQRAAVATALS